MHSTDKWTYNDFLTYLFIMGASADLNISVWEEDFIIQKVGEESYKKIKMFFNDQNDAEHIETITQLYARFENEIGGKENLVNTVKEAIYADHKHEHVMDNYLMMMLRKIL